MEIRMDLNQFFSVLDALFQKNDKRAVQTYLENGLTELVRWVMMKALLQLQTS